MSKIWVNKKSQMWQRWKYFIKKIDQCYASYMHRLMKIIGIFLSKKKKS